MTTDQVQTDSLQADVIAALGVDTTFDAATEAARRVEFLASYLQGTGATGYVLGISGGVDSSTAGRLAQLACESIGATFTAMRLPYGVQADEEDARNAVSFIQPQSLVTVNIKDAADAMHAATMPAGGYSTAARADFVKGNIKARQRMVAQYAVAGAHDALVIGTDHAAEALMGFFTKFGDGACDVTPLAGLTKRRVRAIADHLGAPYELVYKTPTADLEDDRPGLADEVAYGCTYDDIDDYLEGKTVSPEVQEIIEKAYRRTGHKRALPVAP